MPVSSTIEDTLRSGGMLNIRSLVLSLGEYAAPMGTGAALVILACGLFLWTQKDAHMSASVSFLLTCALIAFLFPRQALYNFKCSPSTPVFTSSTRRSNSSCKYSHPISASNPVALR